MTKARLDSLYLMLLGSLVFLLLGGVLELGAATKLVDFRVVYYPARCLLQHADPYMESEVLRAYRAEGADSPTDSEKVRQIVTRYFYLPTAFSFTVPFAMLPWWLAARVWMTITIGSFLVSAFLIWNLGADRSPVLSGVMVGFFLANSELLIVTGNAAAIAISFCVISVWCFVRDRFAAAGILCLAIGLALKPHDTGLVWLYFLLAGGVYRKRALQTAVATVVLSLPAVLWVWHVSPHWMQELNANIAAFAVHGGINDPSVASTGAHGLDMLISLQAVTGMFWDSPLVYNPVAYVVCAPLLLAWAFVTLRSRPTLRNTWLALAAIAALTMLPVYHRQNDAKLLLLTVPACAMLSAEGGAIGWLAVLASGAGFVLTGDLPWAILLALINRVHLPASGLSAELAAGVQIFPAPLILLGVGVFYLWVYARHGSSTASPAAASLRCTTSEDAL
jgi:hypothetical protein